MERENNMSNKPLLKSLDKLVKLHNKQAIKITSDKDKNTTGADPKIHLNDAEKQTRRY